MIERVQVAVVGGGPAGLSAAIAAAEAGAQVVLLDEHSSPGGQLRYRIRELELADGSRPLAMRHAAELAARAAVAGVELRTGHRVWALFAGNELGVESPSDSYRLRPERLILATGSIDRTLPFAGGSIPGVFTDRAVQILLHVDFVLPGNRFAIVADEPEASELRRAIELAGGEVAIVLGTSTNDIAASGNGGVESIRAGEELREVDVVVVAAGRNADTGLAMMAECAAGYSQAFGGFVPKVDERMRTTVEGLYLAGDCAGPCTPEIALLEGAFAGASVAASLGLIDEEALERSAATYRNAATGRVSDLAAVEGSFVQVDRVPMGVSEA
jgi:thioredoxin reductase